MILSESWRKCISESAENYKNSTNNLNSYDTIFTNDWSGTEETPVSWSSQQAHETAQTTKTDSGS